MSLLLDALKRAEEAKRARLSVEAGPDVEGDKAVAIPIADAESAAVATGDSSPVEIVEPDFSLEDYKEYIPAKRVRPPPAAKSTIGDAPTSAELSLENISDVRSGVSREEESTLALATAMTPASQSKLDATRFDAAQSRAAQNAFVAKQAIAPDEASRKKWLLPAIAVGLLAVGVGGWYVWNEINRMSRPAVNLAARPQPTQTLPAAQPATGQPGTPQRVTTPPKVAVPVDAPLPPLLPPLAEQAPLPRLAQRTPATVGAPLTDREALAKSLKEAPAAKEAPVELKLTRAIEAPAVSADLIEAYAALRNADYQRARTLYAKLVLADPLSIDAQLGMATVLARSGDSAGATRHYRQVLVIDPRNGAALAGLLAVSQSKSPSLEAELRTLVGRNPETSSLRFTLGNFYASERRWVEAQQAYFEAYRLESGNADYMYNLAVSLDQLKQPKLAVDYYRKALAARPTAGGQFDPAAVTRRIKDLSTDIGNN